MHVGLFELNRPFQQHDAIFFPLFFRPKTFKNVKDTLKLHHEKAFLFMFKARLDPVWVTLGQFALQCAPIV